MAKNSVQPDLTHDMFKSIIIPVPSIDNQKKIAAIANDIQERIKETRQPKVAVAANSAADEVLKLKNLLDMGIITQEEFDTKKKELLGI